MTTTQFSSPHVSTQANYEYIAEALDSIDATKLLRRLNEYRANGGRRTYQIQSFWRAYMLTFLLDLSSINALIRRLWNDPQLQLLCGFSKLPDRRTFNRFVARLSEHRDLVDECMAQVIEQLKVLIPDLGENVAVDSTAVRTHSNDNKKSKITGQVSDLDATRGVRTNARNPKKIESYFGYKCHILSDVKHQVPLTGFVTPANRSDSPELPTLLEQAESQYSWFRPRYVMADRGYDSASNHEAVLDKDAAFICPMRKWSSKQRYGIYDRNGTPSCEGEERMEYLGTHPDRGHLYKCPKWGCRIQTESGFVSCEVFVWVDWRTKAYPRLHGPVRRGSPEWKRLYKFRQSIERIFKSVKESLRLERHYIRGLNKIALHSSMSALAYTAAALTKTQAGIADKRWMVQRVA